MPLNDVVTWPKNIIYLTNLYFSKRLLSKNPIKVIVMLNLELKGSLLAKLHGKKVKKSKNEQKLNSQPLVNNYPNH